MFYINHYVKHGSVTLIDIYKTLNHKTIFNVIKKTFFWGFKQKIKHNIILNCVYINLYTKQKYINIYMKNYYL